MNSGDELRSLAQALRDDCVELAKLSGRLVVLARPSAPPNEKMLSTAPELRPTLAEWHESIADLLRQSREELRRAREYVERAEL